jgi:hypothetical protein
MKRIDVRCDNDVYAKLTALAKRERRSIHQQVLAILDAALTEGPSVPRDGTPRHRSQDVQRGED